MKIRQPRRFFFDCEFIEEPGFLELISIGVVSMDGEKEFYACNLDADLDRASDWVKENVIGQLPSRSEAMWMSKKAIAEKLLDFLKPSEENPIETWGYYADYDHVVLCWLFGRMIDLPAGMPMFTRDLKQVAFHLGNPRLPVQKKGKHDALADARWNREVYKFLERVAWRNTGACGMAF